MPILLGDEAGRAHQIAREIADEIGGYDIHQRHEVFEPLLDAYLARVFDSDNHAERALSGLARSFRESGHLRAPGLYGGLAGLGWTATHITDMLADWIESYDTDACDEIDKIVDTVVTGGAPIGYDLISGWVGIATYGVERMPRDQARRLLEHVIDRLAAHAESSGSGVTWHTPAEQLPSHQREDAPEGYYNLGVAHGIPGIAVTLGHAARLGIRSEVSRSLLDGLQDWLLAQPLNTGHGAGFKYWTAKGRAKVSEVASEAWCYGGLGLSVALLRAARLVNDKAREDHALRFARLEASRAAEQTRVRDMCLCHGGAGNGHLYNRLYQATGEQVFLDASRRWLLRTMEARRSVDGGPSRYLFHHPARNGVKDRRNPPEPGDFGPDVTFLNGSLGVGLALLAASSHQEPTWDRLLLADLPPLHSRATVSSPVKRTVQ
jgi:lantibiotic biosynthesis protein